jgi:hypothetical protein
MLVLGRVVLAQSEAGTAVPDSLTQTKDVVRVPEPHVSEHLDQIVDEGEFVQARVEPSDAPETAQRQPHCWRLQAAPVVGMGV